MNIRAMILSLVTGLGHIYLRHYVLGAILFSLFAAALNGVFLGSVIESDKALASAIRSFSVPAAAVIWLFGLVHAWKISFGTNRVRLRQERQRLFKEGLIAYLRDELDAAAHALRGVVDRDVDWEDPDALFHLGVVELRRAERFALKGERRAAQKARLRGLRAFRACLARDDRKKWRGEIGMERERSHLPAQPSGVFGAAAPFTEENEIMVGLGATRVAGPRTRVAQVVKKTKDLGVPSSVENVSATASSNVVPAAEPPTTAEPIPPTRHYMRAIAEPRTVPPTRHVASLAARELVPATVDAEGPPSLPKTVEMHASSEKDLGDEPYDSEKMPSAIMLRPVKPSPAPAPEAASPEKKPESPGEKP